MQTALILTDGKAGHENQSKAFVRALGLDSAVAKVVFKSKFHKALSYLFDFFGLYAGWLFTVTDVPQAYSVVVGTGSGVFYAVKVMAKSAGVKSSVILYPRGYNLKTFDCILAPVFDRPQKLDNVVEIPANLVAADQHYYDEGVRAFKERHEPKKRAVAVIVGGPNKCSAMTPEWMNKELDRIFSSNADCEFWVTTSRRTPKDVEAVVESYPFEYKLIFSRDHFNPIPAFVELADRLYVSAESTGMLSEACTFGRAEVFALDNLKKGRHKFRAFIDHLREGGYIEARGKINLSEEIARAKKLLNLI